MSERPLRADARRNRARILAAAGAVFAEKGPAASTEEVADRAGVAIGTVFRHFPTKRELLQAIVKDLRDRITAEADELLAGDPATGLFTFVTGMVAHAAAKKTVIDLLAETGIEVQATRQVESLGQAVGALLDRAQRAGAVRDDVAVDQVVALLGGACQGALHAGWDADLQRRTLAVIFDGLRPR